MVYIIDAYNVIHAVPSFERELERSLKAARDALIAFCRAYQGARGGIEKITIVFDGSSEVFYPPEARTAGIELVYTETHEDADDRIIEILRSRTERGPVAVVTSDRYVSNNARAMSAEVISPADFFAAATRRKKPHDGQAVPPGRGNIPQAIADKITAEYKRLLGLD